MKLGPTIRTYGKASIATFLAAYLFLIPAGIVIHDLGDPGLRDGQAPRFAFRWHRALSPKYERWARQRVASGSAKALSTHDISGTEWPMFGSVFYLWATEALQEAWEEDPSLACVMPKESAQGAIQAAGALVADPNHATWVRRHWGDDYLDRENLFYRMLLISGLTSYQKLLGDDEYEPLLRDQAESLAREIDASPYGLLDDYPGQCYPPDVLPAIAAIRRADGVLGTDHSEFAARAIRAFKDTRLDERTGLPDWRADPRTGQGIGGARGVGVSFMLTWTPELWPETAREWYARYETHFWQREGGLAGFREFPEGVRPEWFTIDVDAGPVIAGYGTTASAFGIGAARANGRFDHAYPLSAEAIAVSWPLPGGTLLGPRLLSDLSDAPYVGESVLLFNLTRRPVVESGIRERGRIPAIVYLVILLYLGAGILCIWMAARSVKHARKQNKQHQNGSPQCGHTVSSGPTSPPHSKQTSTSSAPQAVQTVSSSPMAAAHSGHRGCPQEGHSAAPGVISA
jgi:hypothetical protein